MHAQALTATEKQDKDIHQIIDELSDDAIEKLEHYVEFLMHDEEYQIAIHEAGHAVMMFLQHQWADSITIVPDKMREILGFVRPTDTSKWLHDGTHTKRKVEKYMKFDFAGAVAVEIVCGENYAYEGTGYDFSLAVDALASCMPRDKTTENYTPDEFTQYWIDKLYEDTRRELKLYRNAIKAIADKLMQRKTMSGRLAKNIFSKEARL
jgi:ATP-dependent Zn protease